VLSESQRKPEKLAHPVGGWQQKLFKAVWPSSNDIAIIVAMHLMHRKEKYKSLGLDIFEF
jgi:hypothetical protein